MSLINNLKTMVKYFLINLIKMMGIPILFKFFFQKYKITILYYHNIDERSFKRHLLYIKNHYNIIDLSSLYDFLTNNDINMPNYAVLITFDDGHIGNYKLLDIFKAHNVKPVIFLTAGLIGTHSAFWFNLPFNNKSEKENLKQMPDKKRRDYINEKFKEFTAPQDSQALSIEMVREMSPFVDFQSHTVDHPCLPKCTDEEALYQIESSKKRIEDIVGKPVISIAYPNGDFSIRDIQLVKKAGYKIGFSSKPGFNHRNSDLYSLKRLSINDTDNYNEFILRISGVWAFFKKFKS